MWSNYLQCFHDLNCKTCFLKSVLIATDTERTCRFLISEPFNTLLLEECYGMKDPFSPEREKFLVLGSKCCLCSKTVCSFCLPCVRDHLRQFPEQVQNEVLRKKSVQKTSSS
uniref:Cysteine-rich DPF motif domain-containing protein 1 n=1 Tax=Sinocyclocheilus rhinocerous TaxID=307959 RepID=A0A673KYT4_9TELE